MRTGSLLAVLSTHPNARDAAGATEDLRSRWAGLRADVGIVAALLAVAAVVRFPYLGDAPRFRDETFNALRALQIYRGEIAPLTDVELYMGSFYNYLVAGTFLLTEPNIYAARLVVTLFGIATVGVTYLLGREIGGRAAGLLAAALLLTNGVHVAAVGHVGFSAHINPFFTTLGFWLLLRAVMREASGSLMLAGFAFGMGLHTHPTTIAYLPGALGWLLATGGLRWFRRRSLYLALAAFLLAYSPMIVYNVATGGESIRHAIYTATERPDYALGEDTRLTPASYLERQRDLWVMVYRTVGGALDERRAFWDYLLDPVLAGTAVLGVVSLVWAARRGFTLPIWTLGSLALILALFNANHYDVVGDANYVVKLLPLVFVCMAWWVVWMARRLLQALSPASVRVAAGAVVAALVAVLVGHPLVLLAAYYGDALRSEPTNARLIAAADALIAARQSNELVVLDNRLNERRVQNASPWDEESSFRVIRFILEFEGVAYRVMDVDDDAVQGLVRDGQSAIMVVTSGRSNRDADGVGETIRRFDLRALDGTTPRTPRPDDRFTIVRLDAAPRADAP